MDTRVGAEERGPALTAEVVKSMKDQHMEVNVFHVGAVIGACRSLAHCISTRRVFFFFNWLPFGHLR